MAFENRIRGRIEVRRPWERPPPLVRWCCLLVLSLSALAPLPAHAADRVKIATTMAKQAMQAYENGDFLRAGQLYAEAYRSEPRPEYLYAAARAEQVGGAYNKAIEHFRQTLALKDLDAALRAKCEGYLKTAQQARSDAHALDAEKAGRTGDQRLAAQLYHEAWDDAQERVDLLFKAAVAEQTAGDVAAATADFDLYLQRAPENADDRKQARVRLDGLRGTKPTPVALKAAQPAAPPVPPPALKPVVQPAAQPVVAQAAQPPTTVLAPAPREVRWAAWTTLGGGVALLAGSAGLYFAQGSERQSLDAALAQQSAGKITGIGYDAYVKRRDDLNASYRNAAILGGVGVAAVGVGTWLLLREPAPAVVLGPGPGTAGLSLAGRF